MARPRRHTDEAALGAVRELSLTEGPRGVTIAAVGERRAALDAADLAPAGHQQVVAMGLTTVDHCAAQAVLADGGWAMDAHP
ncbi:hypothetical protein [Modestobacter sp. I12A-02662]|uniref:hypothetical protein n=1 Tax=Modestobacter sp. I12A-02662 TaxID=1730496 RepID=UPI0034DF2833